MSMFAVVKDFAALQPACDAISELLGIRARRYPGTHPDALLGIWVDPAMAVEVGSVLPRGKPKSPGLQADDIESSCGITGQWSVYWLKNIETRAQLIQALLDRRHEDGENSLSAGCFIPFFDTAAPKPEIQAEVSVLIGVDSDRVLTPSYQEIPTGRLFLAPVYGQGPRGVQ